MMRPMKLAGSQLVFGNDCLAFLKTLSGERALIVTGGNSMKKNGTLDKVQAYLNEAGIESQIFDGVESDPSFDTVWLGAECMKKYKPDWIVAVGGGSAMDAAKAMWVYYEHDDLKSLEDILPPKPIPALRKKAKLICIPSTSGTASEVSRSVVITDNKSGIKHGVGHMELMPDIAICDPLVTASMPKHITAETGMDAMTHALEAYASSRANYVSDVLCRAAIKDIFSFLPQAYENGDNLKYREYMLNASMIAGMAFTNVSLGIVHSMAHTLGSIFHVSHGLLDGIILPYVIEFNCQNIEAKTRYESVAKECGIDDLACELARLNQKLGIVSCLSGLISDEMLYLSKVDEMAKMALADGCTKTNPVAPTIEQLRQLFINAYYGGKK